MLLLVYSLYTVLVPGSLLCLKNCQTTFLKHKLIPHLVLSLYDGLYSHAYFQISYGMITYHLLGIVKNFNSLWQQFVLPTLDGAHSKTADKAVADSQSSCLFATRAQAYRLADGTQRFQNTFYSMAPTYTKLLGFKYTVLWPILCNLTQKILNV